MKKYIFLLSLITFNSIFSMYMDMEFEKKTRGERISKEKFAAITQELKELIEEDKMFIEQQKTYEQCINRSADQLSNIGISFEVSNMEFPKLQLKVDSCEFAKKINLALEQEKFDGFDMNQVFCLTICSNRTMCKDKSLNSRQIFWRRALLNYKKFSIAFPKIISAIEEQ